MRYTLLVVLALIGCATRQQSGVVPDGPDTYSVILAGKTGFTSSASLKISAYQKANEFCAAMGKRMEVVQESEQRGGVLGKFPEAHVRFRCT